MLCDPEHVALSLVSPKQMIFPSVGPLVLQRGKSCCCLWALTYFSRKQKSRISEIQGTDRRNKAQRK